MKANLGTTNQCHLAQMSCLAREIDFEAIVLLCVWGGAGGEGGWQGRCPVSGGPRPTWGFSATFPLIVGSSDVSEIMEHIL